jgi:hypothetical protein
MGIGDLETKGNRNKGTQNQGTTSKRNYKETTATRDYTNRDKELQKQKKQ